MVLQALLREVDPGWYLTPGDTQNDVLDADLLRKAQNSALGRRMLARWLASGPASALLAPRPGGGIGSAVTRWPRPRLAGMVRDLGTLAFAPAVRAEIRRDHVSLLKRMLGNGYLLALDNSVWDAAIDAPSRMRLSALLDAAATSARASAKPAAIHELLDAQGRTELRAWALQRDPALADWAALQFPRETTGTPVLPEKQVLFLHSHHEARALAA